MMISYAQNGEDVVLARLFSGQLFGRYIDIGASDPELDSVTKHFYDIGWRGINVEPDPRWFGRLIASRPEDVNLNCAASDSAGSLDLWIGDESLRGLSTPDRVIAAAALGEQRRALSIQAMTLAEICQQHISGPIDFMKIDVEGWERQVILGADWVHYRPRVLVVEATLPNKAIPAHQPWEPLLLDNGYCCVLFDGLNRFYTTSDDLQARVLLASPANPHDDFRQFGYQRALDEYQRLAEYTKVLENTIHEAPSTAPSTPTRSDIGG